MGVLIKNKINYSGGKLLMSPECYNLEEQEIGCWTDGKPLYQKTFYYATLSSSPYDWVLLESFAGVDTLVTYNVMCDYTQGGTKQLGGSYYKLCYMNNGLYYYTQDLGNYIENAYVTIQYTKTSDQPGSGTWTPNGLPTVHYSEAEHIVGTWIDGSPIYEKTIDLGSESMWGWTSGFYLNSYIPSNIDQIISSTGYSATYKCSYPIMILKENDNWNGYTYNGSFIKIITLQYTKSSS